MQAGVKTDDSVLTEQHRRITGGRSWMSGWVTVVPLCCFCNVALIFATMKTFILQQVKCCHLSSSSKNQQKKQLDSCGLFPYSITTLIIFHLLCINKYSSPSFITCFFFALNIHPDIIPHVVVGCWMSASVSQPVGISGGTTALRGLILRDLAFPKSPDICPDLSLFISALGSQLLMKSQSVLWAGS